MNKSNVLLSYAEVYHDDSFVDDKFRDALNARLRVEYGTAWGFAAEGDGVVARGQFADMLDGEYLYEKEINTQMRVLVSETLLRALVAQFVEARDEVHEARAWHAEVTAAQGQEHLANG